MIAIDINGNRIDDAIAIDNGSVLAEKYRVRVIKGRAAGDPKEVVGEMDFNEFPSDMQILFCIRYFRGDFANVQKIYFEDTIPFAKE